MMNKIKTLIIMLLTMGTIPVFAQSTTAGGSNIEETLLGLTILFACIMFATLIGIALIFSTVFQHKETLEAKKAGTRLPPQGFLAYLWSKLNSFDNEKTLENTNEEELHSYDGIMELDNTLPPWWVALFYITIIFSFAYMGYYHVYGGSSTTQEYDIEMATADAELKAYLATQGPTVTEDNVEVNNSPALVAVGKEVYTKNCVVCHGPQAQGLVGPNLTDEYWLHGNDIASIFKIIKYGKVEKGMTAWEKKLSPEEIANTANFILTLKGTNPPNPKAPQGTKY